MLILPTKQEIIHQQWQQAYIHFAVRLRQRYGLDISFEQYKELWKIPFITVKVESQNKSRALVPYQGVWLYVCRDRRHKRLATALPRNKEYNKLLKLTEQKATLV